MKEEFDLNKQNMIIAMLGQSLLGVISQNFRRIALSFEEKKLSLLFTLERENAIDKEEAEDASEEFGCLLTDLDDNEISLEAKIVVDSARLELLDVSKWVTVFLRREIV